MRCPACDLAELIPIADLGEVPVLSGFTWDTGREATTAPRGAMRLACCPACAHTVNTAFEPERMRYSGEYDNSLHHSPLFAAYAAELANHLAKRYELRGQTVLEPGCGKGEFLRELCIRSGARGLGYDVTYQGPQEADGARFVRDYVRVDGTVPAFDFLVSRHVLEHLVDPYRFLVDLRTLAGDRPVHGYIEVPDARYDLGGPGWGCIYPHVGYFTAASLSTLLRRAGYTVLATDTAFGGVFRYAEIATAEPVPANVDELPDARDDLAAVTGLGERHAATVRTWRRRIKEHVTAGHRVALWGAGARGVAFLNAVDPERELTAVVDRNPAKHGRYLPYTAHQVTAPDDLAGHRIDTVIITNATYRAEIHQQITELGVDADIWVAAVA